jgi:hypothetical protein
MTTDYNGTIRTFIARNVLHTKTISPPSDITFASSDFRTVVAGIMPRQLNQNSRMIVRRIGLFCNFADGLVFKNEHQRFDISAKAIGVENDSLLTSTATTAIDSRTLSGVGTDDDATLSDGDILYAIAGSPARGQYLVVDGSPAATSTDVTQFPLFASAGDVTINKVSPTGSSDDEGFIHVNALNTMYDMNWFVNPANLDADSLVDTILLFNVNQDLLIGGGSSGWTVDSHSTAMLTKSVDTDFSDDTVTMDIVMECETTLRTL